MQSKKAFLKKCAVRREMSKAECGGNLKNKRSDGS